MRPVRVHSPAPREVWRDLVDRSRDALPSQLPAWTDAICALGHYEDVSRMYEVADGRTLVLPMVRRTSFGPALATEYSMSPTWGTGGLLTDGRLGVADVAAVFDDLRASPALRTTVRPDFLQAPLWEQARPSRAIPLPVTHHVLDLDRPYEELHARFSKMARKAIRKADKEGVTVASSLGAVHVREFYGLYENWIERRAVERHLPVSVARLRGHANEPLDRLLVLSHALGSSFRVWTARLDGEPIAAMITLIRGEQALAWRAASNKDLAGPTRAMDLIHRHAIEYACEQGCRYYNMGESGGVESLMRFKARFGATPREFAGYRLERLPITPVSSRLNVVKVRAEQFAMSAAAAIGGFEFFG